MSTRCSTRRIPDLELRPVYISVPTDMPSCVPASSSAIRLRSSDTGSWPARQQAKVQLRCPTARVASPTATAARKMGTLTSTPPPTAAVPLAAAAKQPAPRAKLQARSFQTAHMQQTLQQPAPPAAATAALTMTLLQQMGMGWLIFAGLILLSPPQPP
jgi:hypothetical protein